MSDQDALLIRFREASVEQILNWLDAWVSNNGYKSDEKAEDILLKRNEPLLDAALAEYSSLNHTLEVIYKRTDLPLRRLCLSRVDSKWSDLDGEVFPNDNTIIDILSLKSIENGLIKSYTTNPKINPIVAKRILNREGAFSYLEEPVWRRFLFYLSRNPLLSSNGERTGYSDYIDFDMLVSDIWELSLTLETSEDNATWLANTYSGLLSTYSDDAASSSDYIDYNNDKPSDEDDSHFIVVRVISRWYKTSEAATRLCVQLMRCLGKDTDFFNKLADHDDLEFRKAYYREVDMFLTSYNEEKNIELLEKWYAKDGRDFFCEAIKNCGIVSHCCLDKWFTSKISEVAGDYVESRWLKQDLEQALKQSDAVPVHLKADYNYEPLNSDSVTIEEKQDRLQQQVDVLYQNLLGRRDVVNEPIVLGDNASLGVLASVLGDIQTRITGLEKAGAISKFAIVLVIAVVFFFLGYILG